MEKVITTIYYDEQFWAALIEKIMEQFLLENIYLAMSLQR